MRLAPAFSIAGSITRVVARSGKPAATNGISAICLRCLRAENVCAIETRLIARDDTGGADEFVEATLVSSFGAQIRRVPCSCNHEHARAPTWQHAHDYMSMA